ncbi:MAG: methionine synthase [Nocardioidaceae bacterium]|nr:methionine synthase [Nocardioidaceae bacterium]
MPGEDFGDSMQTVLGEVGDFPYLVELPQRGVTASMVGRTLAAITHLGLDLQPAGWRLTDASGLDHRRAKSLLARDLDTVEELAQDHRGHFKLQVTGPWTLAANVERPRGDKVLADHGARRDLAQALAEGVRDYVGDVRRRLAGAQIVVQVDEPALPAVLAGAISTASGFGRHRSVTPAAASQALDWVLDAVADGGASSAVHCCAGEVPFAVLRETPAQAVSFDLALMRSSQFDDVAGWLEAGRQVWLGVVPSTEPTGRPPTENELTKDVLTWWSALGHSDVSAIPAATITPACGLAGASPHWARTALGLAHRVARNLSVEQGRMEA